MEFFYETNKYYGMNIYVLFHEYRLNLPLRPCRENKRLLV